MLHEGPSLLGGQPGPLRPGLLQTSLPLTFPGVGVTPPIRIETSSPSVIEGQTVDLNCLVAARLQSRVKWYKRGGALPVHSQVRGGWRAGGWASSLAPQRQEGLGSGGHPLSSSPHTPLSSPLAQILGSRLRILQASAADSGEYVCYVSEGSSPLEASVIVSIPSSSGSTYCTCSRSTCILCQQPGWPSRACGGDGAPLLGEGRGFGVSQEEDT